MFTRPGNLNHGPKSRDESSGFRHTQIPYQDISSWLLHIQANISPQLKKTPQILHNISHGHIPEISTIPIIYYVYYNIYYNIYISMISDIHDIK